MSPIESHLREIAEESGLDYDAETATSREGHATLPGTDHLAETFYQESATWQPWRAFLAGVGTGSGWDATEALADLAAMTQATLAKGGLVGPAYLASLTFPHNSNKPTPS